MAKFLLTAFSLLILINLCFILYRFTNYNFITVKPLSSILKPTSDSLNNNNSIIIRHHYREEDVVMCLNQLSLLKTKGRPFNNNAEPIEIALVGDSTIRNLFQSFLRV